MPPGGLKLNGRDNYQNGSELERLVLRHRIGLVLVAGLMLLNVVALPLAILNLFKDLSIRDEIFALTSADVPLAESHAVLNLEVLNLDDINRTITIRASGHHVCSACDWEDRITLLSIPIERSGTDFEGVPPSATVALPSNADTVTTTFELPIHGTLVRYPFDVHTLQLGITQERKYANGRIEKLTAANSRGHLRMNIRDGAARADLSPPVAVDPSTVQPTRVRVEYVDVRQIIFVRPLFLRIIIPLVVALIAAAAFYAVFLRPFQDLIMNSGSLVLGVWGVRSLLLGNYPPNVTFVDAVLTLIIVLLLFAISLRALAHLYERAELSLLHRLIRQFRRETGPVSDNK